MPQIVFQKIGLIALALPFCACGESLNADRDLIQAKDPRNQAVEFTLDVAGENLEYCIEEMGDTASAMDVFRVFLQTADHFKERPFNSVILCFRGEPRFILSGTDFSEIGSEFETQNPMYTLRTFPEKLALPDGASAYETHRGGLLYLMKVQMADFTDMNEKWYLKELLAETKAEKDALRPKEFAPDEEAF